MQILIIRFSSLGDLVTLEPTFRAFRSLFSNARISFLTSNIGYELYSGSNLFDQFIIYENLNSLRELRKIKFDYLINLQCTTRSFLVSGLLNKNKVINQSGNFLEKKLKINKPLKLGQLLERMPLTSDQIVAYLNTPDAQLIKLVSSRKKISSLIGQANIVVIAIGASERWVSKKWGINKFKKLISLLLDGKCKVVLVGSDNEIDESREIESLFPNVINYVGLTRLKELIDIISLAEVFIGNDSGPAHVAAGLGINTISIFGPTSEKHCVRFAEYKGDHLCLTPDSSVSCHPCYLPICPTEHECMNSISVETVFGSVNLLLREPR